MDDMVRTVGERSLAKLYEEATTLISRGSGKKDVIQLKPVLRTIHLIIEPLSKANMDYNQAFRLIQKDLKEAEEKEKGRAIVDSMPETYGVLTNWFRELNSVLDDNNLLFSSSMVYQESNNEKWGTDDDKTPL